MGLMLALPWETATEGSAFQNLRAVEHSFCLRFWLWPPSWWSHRKSHLTSWYIICIEQCCWPLFWRKYSSILENAPKNQLVQPVILQQKGRKRYVDTSPLQKNQVFIKAAFRGFHIWVWKLLAKCSFLTTKNNLTLTDERLQAVYFEWAFLASWRCCKGAKCHSLK